MTRKEALSVLRMYIGGCREDLGAEKGRCGEPVEFVLWGKLIPSRGLGPRCYDHAVRHVGHDALRIGSGYALVNLNEIATVLADPDEDRIEHLAEDALTLIEAESGVKPGPLMEDFVRGFARAAVSMRPGE